MQKVKRLENIDYMTQADLEIYLKYFDELRVKRGSIDKIRGQMILDCIRRDFCNLGGEWIPKDKPKAQEPTPPPAEPSERGSKWRRGRKQKHERAERPRVEEPPEEPQKEPPKEEEKPDPDAWKKEPWAEELWEKMGEWSRRIWQKECRETDIYLNRKLETDMASPESCREFLEWIKQWERRIEEEKRKQEEEQKKKEDDEDF